MQKKIADFIGRAGRPDFVIYTLKCLAGASICYGLYSLFPGHQFSWSIVSVLLVLSPEEVDSNRLALERIKANVTGASIGLLAYLIHAPNIFMLCGSVLATVLTCAFFELGNSSRSALAALAIVLIQEKEKHTYASALERMMCVIAGCLVAMAITFVFSLLRKKASRAAGTGGAAAQE